MPTPLVALFYLWLVASLVVLVYRRATRSRGRTPMARAADTDRALRTDWSPPPGTPPPATPPAGPAPVPPATSPAAAPPAAAPVPTADPSVLAASGVPVVGAHDGSEGEPATVAAPATTLIEALAGISMPCDLMPLTAVEGRLLSDRDLLLITSGQEAGEVGAAFASALEALGYAITPMGPVTALATRGPDRITVVLHERPHDELSGKRSAFPTTKPGDVVLEVRL